jgi:hypothetical protein
MNTKNWILGMVCAIGISNVVSASPIILNEYNAVKSSGYLKDNKSDTYFGRIPDNGGNWFELVITEDHLDMRGWTLNWQESSKAGTITLSNDTFWSNMRQGVILTFIERPATGGGKSTDTTLNYSNDWWANICTLQEQYQYSNSLSWLARTVYTSGGGNAGDFTTSNDGWKVQIKDGNDVVMDWTGEGYFSNGGVGSDEIFKLEANPSATIARNSSSYKDGTTSTFGSPNLWSDGVGSQNFSTLRAGVPEPATLIFLGMSGLYGLIRRK